MTEFKTLDIEVNESAATIFINRPEKKNALNTTFFKELSSCLEELDANSAIRVAILTSRTSFFSSGLDLSSLEQADSQGPSKRTSKATEAKSLFKTIKFLQGCVSKLSDVRFPIICAIKGYCIGGGLDLAAACDLRIATADAIFSLRETKMAMVADLGSLQRLNFIISSTYLNELAFSGKDITAKKALEIGLLNYVLEDEKSLVQKAKELADEIKANSPLAVEGTKALLRNFKQNQIANSLHEAALYNSAFLNSNDLLEAIKAFFEKRNPNFYGT